MTTTIGGALYVGDLNGDVTEMILFETFNTVGPVASVRVCRDAATRRSLGYAYVNYHRAEDAEKAIEILNFRPINNRSCRVMWSQRDPSLRKSGVGNLFVKNLAPNVDNLTFYETFSNYGNILSCKVVSNPKAKKALNYGFVQYETDEAAKEAIKCVNGKHIGNQQVTVETFKSAKQRRQNWTNVYLRVAPDTTEEEFVELVKPYGTVTSYKLIPFSRIDRDTKELTHLKYAFANFSSTEEAQKAIASLNDADFKGTKLYVAKALLRHERERELNERREKRRREFDQLVAGRNLYVKNLESTIDSVILKAEFSKCGEVTSAVVVTDANGKSKGFGYVCFAKTEDAERALALKHNDVLEGKRIFVAPHQRKEVRHALLAAQFSNRPKYPAGYDYMYQNRYMPQYPRWPAQPMPQNYYPQVPIPSQQRMFALTPRVLPPVGDQQRQSQRPRVAAGGRPNQQRPQGGQPRTGRTMTNTGRQQWAMQLVNMPPDQQKQFLGEKLYPLVNAIEATHAGKITGMLLEMDVNEIIHLVENPEARSQKVQEALSVLQTAGVDA